MRIREHLRAIFGYGIPVLAVAAVLLTDIWWDPNFELVANISIAVMAGAVNAFTVLYAWRSNWQSNRIGRIFLRKSLLLSLVLDQIVLSVWWDEDYPFRQHVRFALYALGAIAYVAMVVSLVQEQNRDRRGAGTRSDV